MPMMSTRSNRNVAFQTAAALAILSLGAARPSLAIAPTSPTAGTCGNTFATPSLDLMTQPATTSSEAKPHSWPWAVSIQISNQHQCGGSLIRTSNTKEESDLVLTAAHCVAKPAGKLQLLFGGHSLTNPKLGQLLPMAKFVMHPAYNADTGENDIALIKLATPVQFSDKIQPVCLPPASSPTPANSTAVVAGWGPLSESGSPLPGNLMQVAVPLISDGDCAKAWPGFASAKNLFCAGYIKGKDACQGEKGMPLMSKVGDKWELRGVVSFGKGCAPNKPRAFTRISSYTAWIDKQAATLSAVAK